MSSLSVKKEGTEVPFSFHRGLREAHSDQHNRAHDEERQQQSLRSHSVTPCMRGLSPPRVLTVVEKEEPLVLPRGYVG